MKFSFPNGCEAETTVRNAIHGLPKPGLLFQRHHLAGHSLPSESLDNGSKVPRSSRSLQAKRRPIFSPPRHGMRESPTVAYGNREIHIHPNGGRRLTVFEALLLQGFPKTLPLNWQFQRASDSNFQCRSSASGAGAGKGNQTPAVNWAEAQVVAGRPTRLECGHEMMKSQTD